MEHSTPPHTRSRRVLFVTADPAEGAHMAGLIRESGYRSVTLGGLDAVEAHLAGGAFLAAILDLDNLTVDNPTMRRLAQRFPAVCFFCSSRTNYHPELQEAIRTHFFACLPRPVDPEELAYWLRCAAERSWDFRDRTIQDNEDL